MINIDCNNHEPGNTIRIALSLSIIKNTPVKITNIRKENNEKKGLILSDIQYITILSQLSNAKVEGLEKESLELTFTPGKINETGKIITLKFPCLVPIFLIPIILIYYNKKHKLRINGPTNREGKITIDYIKEVIVRQLDKIGIKMHLDIVKRGYFQDLGSVILTTRKTNKVKPLNLTKLHKEIDLIYAKIHSYGHKESMNQFLFEGASQRLKQKEYKINTWDNFYLDNNEKFKGYGIDLFAICEDCTVGDGTTSIKKQASQLGKETADRLISILDRKLPLDKHASNIMIPFLALSKEPSEILIHKKDDDFIQTTAYVCNKILGTEFEFEDNEKENYTKMKIIPKLL
jgi:RNA 3'-terminal phosphate cyclase (GTP)